MEGWVKIQRNLLDNKSFWKNKDKLAIWLFLMLKATHKSTEGRFEGKTVILKEGELLISYQEIADFLGIDKSKVKRAIQSMRENKQIDTRTDRQKSLITLNCQGVLQKEDDTLFDTRMTHERHTKQDREKEKEKRSKREKEKEKEKNKNERMKEVCVCACDTHENIISLGRYEPLPH